MTTYTVKLAVYDLTQGMARQLGPALLGMELEAIYHTGIIVYEKEFFFGGGINAVPHEEFRATYHLQPMYIEDLGETEVPEEVFDDYIREISPRYTTETYDLLRHNCNNFSNEAAIFLLGRGIPQHIVELPERVFSSPMGMMLRPMIEQMQGGMRTAVPGFHFESFEGTGQPHHINAPPPLVPPSSSSGGYLHPSQQQQPFPPPFAANNPWAILPTSAPATTTPTAVPVPPPSSAPAPSQPRPPVTVVPPPPAKPTEAIPAILAANDKPLLSIEPPAALSRSLATVLSKLRALATSTSPPTTTDDGGAESSSSLLSPEDDAMLTATQEALLNPSKPLPSGIQGLMQKILNPPWPAKAEFFALSLLRPLFLRPSFVTAHLLSWVVSRLASSPESFASKASVVVALSGLSNACAHSAGRTLLLEPERAAVAADAALSSLRDDRPEVRQMASAFLANLALGMEPKDGEELSDLVVQILCGTLEGAADDSDPASAFRRLLCAGRLIGKNGAAAATLVGSLGFDGVIREAGKKGGGKVEDLASELLDKIARATAASS